MTRSSTPDWWVQWCGAMAKDLEVLAQSGPELMARARYGLRDGYPTSSMGGGGGNGVSDPVGELVIADKGRDPIRDAARRMQSCVENAGRELQYAVSALHNSQPVDPEQVARFRNEQVKRCGTCSAVVELPARIKADECETCHRYRDRNGRTRPSHLWRKAS